MLLSVLFDAWVCFVGVLIWLCLLDSRLFAVCCYTCLGGYLFGDCFAAAI